MKTFDALKAKIEKELDIKAYSFQRVYSSSYQLTGFAMSWIANIEGEEGSRIGSNLSATKLLLNNNKLEVIHKDEYGFIEIM